ncbi:WD40/YVTN/BNR-like repeat-containing protein [Roseateles sp.]|uniref:WD40/YVTN/BNR-like repeat-containing protein n=1 Tax=Roseateles sp. TaxID=1971397 RepID=UPI0037CABA7B
MLLDLAQVGERLVAVGERGHVLLSDDLGRSWRQARAVPTRATLACIHATDGRRVWAAGHGGVILTSDDAGETWSLAAGAADGPDVLLAIRVEADGRGLAVGSYGLAWSTADAGKSWARKTLIEGEAGERHMNRIFATKTGRWLIAAEGGQVLNSVDGRSWVSVSTPYKGSLWTGLQLPGGALLAGGMRGNVVRSVDDGLTWQHHPVPQAGSFTAATVLSDGRPLLVGVDGTVVLGDREGTRFDLRRQDDRATLTGVVSAGGSVVVSTTAGPRTLSV